jgi:hypothetical protein
MSIQTNSFFVFASVLEPIHAIHKRYDVALGINTLGALHVLNFAKKCVNVKMLVHVSTGEHTFFFFLRGAKCFDVS